MKPFEQRLSEALRRMGGTEAERAARIGRTVRAIDEWEKGNGIAPLLERLEQLGIIHLADDSCPCRQQPETHPDTVAA